MPGQMLPAQENDGSPRVDPSRIEREILSG
jgi:hypothetical protein